MLEIGQPGRRARAQPVKLGFLGGDLPYQRVLNHASIVAWQLAKEHAR